MIVSLYDGIERVAEKTYSNSRQLRTQLRQRRDQVVDIFGQPISAVGDGGAPAQLYFSVSPDLIYYHRLSFKLTISPFVSTTGSGTQSAVVDVHEKSLSISGGSISPNPHDHATSPHTHNMIAGVTLVNTDADDFAVSIDGVDVTPYLMAQYGGEWIDGQGTYPSMDINKNYDLLEVASDLKGEGRLTDLENLLRPGYKRVEISSAKPFSATLTLYLKYSHLGR